MDLKKIDRLYQKASYYKQSDQFTIEEWQYALRKKFAETHQFRVENIGQGLVYSDYKVYNPETKNSYKVALRGKENEANFCECNDFKTNGLGTCKHIEATFFYIKDKLNKGHLLDIDFVPGYSSVYLDYRNRRKVKIRPGKNASKEFSDLVPLYFNPDYTLKDEAFEQFEQFNGKAYQMEPSFRCYPDALAYIITKREDIKRAKLIEEKYVNAKEPVKGLVNASLFPYQVEGTLFAAKSGRCIIADDMGLGKTLQAIAATYLLKKEFSLNKVLIVCPTSLKYQWQSEIKKFTGEAALIVEGVVTKRQEMYSYGAYDHCFKITSYHTAVNDIDHINQEDFDLVILDEAQRIKNFNTRISRNIKQLKSNYAFILTGTPLENKLEELYSIVQFIDPFALGPYYKFMNDHQIKDGDGKIIGYKNLNEIGKRLSSLMIRRKKTEVLKQLPRRMDKNLEVPMTPHQQAMHDEFASHVAQITNKWKRQGFLNEKDRQRLMIAMNQMRMSCDSTYIIDQETRHDTKIDELTGIIEEVVAGGDEKIVVFSQWERMTRLITRELDRMQIGYQNLNGSVPGHKRGQLFEEFKDNPQCRVFVSTDAGGLGLNLQSASILVNMDIPWNPAVLEQRIARVYRLGQERLVSIINMVSKDTIEHRMLQVIGFKKGLAEGILDQGENTIFMGESKFKQFMETVEKVTEGLPGDHVSTFDMQEIEEERVDEKIVADGKKMESDRLFFEGKAIQGNLFGDDDVIAENDTVDSLARENNEGRAGTAATFPGGNALDKLSKIIGDASFTDHIMDNLIENDPVSGKKYMKIPVENIGLMEDALKQLLRVVDKFKENTLKK